MAEYLEYCGDPIGDHFMTWIRRSDNDITKRDVKTVVRKSSRMSFVIKEGTDAKYFERIAILKIYPSNREVIYFLVCGERWKIPTSIPVIVHPEFYKIIGDKIYKVNLKSTNFDRVTFIDGPTYSITVPICKFSLNDVPTFMNILDEKGNFMYPYGCKEIWRFPTGPRMVKVFDKNQNNEKYDILRKKYGTVLGKYNEKLQIKKFKIYESKNFKAMNHGCHILCFKNTKNKYNITGTFLYDRMFFLDMWCDDLLRIESGINDNKISYFKATYKNGTPVLICSNDVIPDASTLYPFSEEIEDTGHSTDTYRINLIMDKEMKYRFYISTSHTSNARIIENQDYGYLKNDKSINTFDNIYGLNDIFLILEYKNKYAICNSVTKQGENGCVIDIVTPNEELSSEYSQFKSGWYESIDAEMNDEFDTYCFKVRIYNKEMIIDTNGSVKSL